MHRKTRILLLLAALLALSAFAEASTSGMAKRLRNAVPRYHGKKDFDPKDRDYLIGIGVLAAVPIVLAILFLLVAIIFCICRCCALCNICSCCVRKPRAEGYTKGERFLPLLFLAAFGALTASFAAAGLAENQKFSKTLTAKNEISYVSFVPIIVDHILDKVDSIEENLGQVFDLVQPTVDNITADVNSAITQAQDGTTDIKDALQQYDDDWSSYDPPLAGFTKQYHCLICDGFAGTISDIISEIQDQADPIVNDINSTLNGLKDDLIDKVEDIHNATEDALDDIRNEIRDAADKVSNNTEKVTDKIEKYDPKRRSVTIAIFVIPLAGLALAALGLLFKLQFPFLVNVWVYFFMTFLFLLLLGVHLPLAVVLGDACVYADAKQNKLLEDYPDSKGAQVATACLDDTSVLAALNKTEVLNWRENIEFPNVTDIHSDFVFDTFNDLFDQVQGLSIFEAFDVVPSDDDNDETQLGIILDQIKADLTDVQNTILAAQTNFDNVGDVVDGLKNTTQPLFDAGDKLLGEDHCGFLGDDYRELKALICTKTVNNISVMALACFIIAFSGPVIIIASQLSASRVPRPMVKQGSERFDEIPVKENVEMMSQSPLVPVSPTGPEYSSSGAAPPAYGSQPYGSNAYPQYGSAPMPGPSAPAAANSRPYATQPYASQTGEP